MEKRRKLVGLRVMAVIGRMLDVEEEVEYMRPTSPSCSLLAPGGCGKLRKFRGQN